MGGGARSGLPTAQVTDDLSRLSPDDLDRLAEDKLNLSSIAADYTATADDTVLIVDASSGAVTVTLPSASSAGAGKVYKVKKIDVGGYYVTVSSASTIDDQAGGIQWNSQYNSFTFVSDGSEWWIV